MENFELKTLVFNDTQKSRTFRSSDFNFILDKDSKFGLCYGQQPEYTPTYDPLSPQEIDFIIDGSFKFDNFLSFLNKALNINKTKKNQLITISTISTINIVINSIYDQNINEILKLIQYLNRFNFFINLVIKNQQISQLRDVLRLKLFNVNNIQINAKSFKAQNLLNQINLLLSKNFSPSYNFYLNKQNFKEFQKLIQIGFPGNTFSNIIFENPVAKSNKKSVLKSIKDKGNFTICNTANQMNDDLTNANVKKYQDGLFKCYFNFISAIISITQDQSKKGIKFEDVERIETYWHSKQFDNFRKKFVKTKYQQKESENK